jgi:tetrahydromethanopterin S-methyltransferase subunit G
LRNELNQAAALQLDAKEMMKEEAEFNDLLGVEGMMTDVEIRYITTTEQVKSISKQLVLAEKAFTMVKERVERLVQKYENILEKIDQDGEARGVDMEDEDEVCLSEDEVDERGRLERRAERAELRAELSAREAQMLSLTVEKTKQEAENIRREKEEEIIELQQRLDDLEKKSAFLAREYESKLSLKILDKAKHMVAQNEQKAMSVHSLDEEASAAKERIKARFRNRSAHKGNTVAQNQQRDSSETPRPSRNSFHQRLEFYERSLRSIEQT